MSNEPNHPQQPVCFVGDVIRFKQNAIVRYLIDLASQKHIADMNSLAIIPFSQDDRMQFAQLIGYSVSGYGDLSYASIESVAEADEAAENLLTEKKQQPVQRTYWKTEFLSVRAAIDKLVECHLHSPDGTVQELLAHHLRKAAELLAADVNGGLDDEYAGELEALRKSQEEVL